MFILDTNVISELRKAHRADRNVVEWSTNVRADELFISAISILELEQGIFIIERRDTMQGGVLRQWLENYVLKAFAVRTLPIDTAVARRCAGLHIPNPKAERDALIGATALVHSMTIVTRNIPDFAGMDVRLVNPWAP